MLKKLQIFICCLVIAGALVGCDITLASIDKVASTAHILVSPDKKDIFVSIFYSGKWWYAHYNTVSQMMKHNSASFFVINNARNLYLEAGYRITAWAALPEAIRTIFVTNLVRVLPLTPVWQAPILVLPLVPDMPQLIVEEVPM